MNFYDLQAEVLFRGISREKTRRNRRHINISVWHMTVLSMNTMYTFFPIALKTGGKSEKANNHTPELGKLFCSKGYTELNAFTSSYQ